MNFSEKDFEIFWDADGDSCKACMSEKKVSRDEYQAYRDRFVDELMPKFESLWTYIEPVLHDCGLQFKFNFEPKSENRKMRSLCYAILCEQGAGQNRAQLNLRLSFDRRPNDQGRRRKFGIKFAIHHKCKAGLTNLDLQNFVKNVTEYPKIFVYLLKELDDDYLVFKNYGKGIDDDYIKATQVEIDNLDDLFFCKRGDDVFFQEIHKSLYWDDPNQKRIIENHRFLSIECVKAILKLYPIYLYAISRDPESLIKSLQAFDNKMRKRQSLFECTECEKPEKHFRRIDPGQKLSLKEIYKDYVRDATKLIIGDPFIGLKSDLRDGIVNLTSVVRDKPNCKVTIKTKKYNHIHPDDRRGILQLEYGKALEDFKKDLETLGFNREKIQLIYDDTRERQFETNIWEVISGHPLDFFDSRGLTKKNKLIFSPKVKIICR